MPVLVENVFVAPVNLPPAQAAVKQNHRPIQPLAGVPAVPVSVGGLTASSSGLARGAGPVDRAL